MKRPNIPSNPEKGRSNAIASRFCLFVSSSDRARDVFEIVFQNSEKMWRDCDWPRYVGFTSKHPDMYGFKAIPAKAPSGWREELGDQLDRAAAKNPPPQAGEGGAASAATGGGLPRLDIFDAGARLAKDFAAERANPNVNLFTVVSNGNGGLLG